MKKYLCTTKPGYTYVRIKGKYVGRITAPRGTADHVCAGCEKDAGWGLKWLPYMAI